MATLEEDLLTLAAGLDDSDPTTAAALRSTLAKHRAQTVYGISWLSGNIETLPSREAALKRLSRDNQFYMNSKLYERTGTAWRPSPETGRVAVTEARTTAVV